MSLFLHLSSLLGFFMHEWPHCYYSSWKIKFLGTLISVEIKDGLEFPDTSMTNIAQQVICESEILHKSITHEVNL